MFDCSTHVRLTSTWHLAISGSFWTHDDYIFLDSHWRAFPVSLYRKRKWRWRFVRFSWRAKIWTTRKQMNTKLENEPAKNPKNWSLAKLGDSPSFGALANLIKFAHDCENATHLLNSALSDSYKRNLCGKPFERFTSNCVLVFFPWRLRLIMNAKNGSFIVSLACCRFLSKNWPGFSQRSLITCLHHPRELGMFIDLCRDMETTGQKNICWIRVADRTFVFL